MLFKKKKEEFCLFFHVNYIYIYNKICLIFCLFFKKIFTMKNKGKSHSEIDKLVIDSYYLVNNNIMLLEKFNSTSINLKLNNNIIK